MVTSQWVVIADVVTSRFVVCSHKLIYCACWCGHIYFGCDDHKLNSVTTIGHK